MKKLPTLNELVLEVLEKFPTKKISRRKRIAKYILRKRYHLKYNKLTEGVRRYFVKRTKCIGCGGYLYGSPKRKKVGMFARLCAGTINGVTVCYKCYDRLTNHK